MKRLIAMLLALLLCGLPALAELWYTDDVLEDGSPVYYFEELSLTLPADWAGKVLATAGEGRTAFYQRASYERYKAEGLEGGGFLFALGASVNGSFSQLPAFRYLGFSEASAMNYYLELPTDYPAYMDDAIRAEYDAMAAQIDYVAEHASFYAAAPAEDAADAADAGVTLERARYHFEHSALPRYFYETPDVMLEVLGQSGIFRLWQSLADENGVAYPYTEADYAQERFDTEDGTAILRIRMPRPEAAPQCYRVYMVYNAGTGAAGYYTVEFEDLLGETPLLCGWTRALEHVVYGGAPLAEDGAALEEELAQVVALTGTGGGIRAGSAGE